MDFYLPGYNIAIECQGEQHFGPVDFSGHNPERAEADFVSCVKNDQKKFKKCSENGIKLIYYADKEYENKSKKIYSDLNELFEAEIKEIL